MTLLLILLHLISITEVHAQPDSAWVRRQVDECQKANEESNRNKAQLIKEGRWNLAKFPGMVFLRNPLEEMPGMRDYESYHIPFCFDHSPSPSVYQDFFNTVNSSYTHSFDGSTGTLFEYAQAGYAAMQNNPARVVAAADGIIIAKGDGNYDQNCAYTPGNGNYMIIEHSDGRRTGYYHLRNGLITRKSIGDFINEGEPIGYPGGLHGTFLQLPVRSNLFFELRDAGNNVVDPFGFPNGYPADRIPSSWRDSTFMKGLVGGFKLKYLKTMKHTPLSADNCGEPVYDYTDHFNPGDPFYIRYAISNYDVYNDSVIVDVFNPLGVPILPTHIRPRLCVNCGTLVYLITAIQYISYTLPVNPVLMIPGTYTVVLKIPNRWTGGYQTYYLYFTVGCQSDYTLTQTRNGEAGFLAGNNIYNYETCNSGSRVKYVAGNEVVLYPGFVAFNGSNVMIYTEPCTAPPRLADQEDNTGSINEIQLAPNPASDFITIKIKDCNSAATLRIYNSTLQLVKILTIENVAEQIISLAEFENGIYFIDAQAGDFSYRSKFVISR